MLFDDTGEALCWLCSSRKKVQATAHNPSEEDKKYEERRAWTRYPVQMHLKFCYGDSEKSKIIFPGVAVNISMGGMCVEWTPCEECSGYQAGAIHPNCIFSRYDTKLPESESLLLSLFLSESEVVNLYTKVVFVIRKEDGHEYLGLSFDEIDIDTKRQVEELINQLVATNG